MLERFQRPLKRPALGIEFGQAPPNARNLFRSVIPTRQHRSPRLKKFLPCGNIEQRQLVLKPTTCKPGLAHCPLYSSCLNAVGVVVSLSRPASPPPAIFPAFNLGLKPIPVDRRRRRDRETCLFAIAQGPTTGGRRTWSSPGHSFSFGTMVVKRSMSRRSWRFGSLANWANAR